MQFENGHCEPVTTAKLCLTFWKYFYPLSLFVQCAVTALTWGHNDKRLFVATGTQVNISTSSGRFMFKVFKVSILLYKLVIDPPPCRSILAGSPRRFPPSSCSLD